MLYRSTLQATWLSPDGASVDIIPLVASRQGLPGSRRGGHVRIYDSVTIRTQLLICQGGDLHPCGLSGGYALYITRKVKWRHRVNGHDTIAIFVYNTV